jgi:DNA repair protein RecO (recombination protein O)
MAFLDYLSKLGVMVERNVTAQAIVLQNRKSGESNRNLTLLSKELGIFEVTCYGMRKPKAGIHVRQFMEGVFYLYYYQTRKRFVLKDFNPLKTNDGILLDYAHVVSADLLCEFVLKTGCDDMTYAYRLLSRSLELLCLGNIPEDLIVIQFLLRLIRENGFFSSFERCPVCDREIDAQEVMSFTSHLSAPCCEQCGDLGATMILPPGARRYLSLTMDMELDQALEVRLTVQTGARIRAYMQRWAMHVIGRPFRSLDAQVAAVKN